MDNEILPEASLVAEWSKAIVNVDFESAQRLYKQHTYLLWQPLDRNETRIDTDYAHLTAQLERFQLLGPTFGDELAAIPYILLDHLEAGNKHGSLAQQKRSRLLNFLIKNARADDLNNCTWGACHNTMLHLAAFLGQPRTMDQLVQRGASIDKRNDLGHLPNDVAQKRPTNSRFRQLRAMAESTPDNANDPKSKRQSTQQRRQQDIALLSKRSAVKNNPLLRKLEQQQQEQQPSTRAPRPSPLARNALGSRFAPSGAAESHSSSSSSGSSGSSGKLLAIPGGTGDANTDDQPRRTSKIMSSLKNKSYVSSSVFRQHQPDTSPTSSPLPSPRTAWTPFKEQPLTEEDEEEELRRAPQISINGEQLPPEPKPSPSLDASAPKPSLAEQPQASKHLDLDQEVKKDYRAAVQQISEHEKKDTLSLEASATVSRSHNGISNQETHVPSSIAPVRSKQDDVGRDKKEETHVSITVPAIHVKEENSVMEENDDGRTDAIRVVEENTNSTFVQHTGPWQQRQKSRTSQLDEDTHSKPAEPKDPQEDFDTASIQLATDASAQCTDLEQQHQNGAIQHDRQDTRVEPAQDTGSQEQYHADSIELITEAADSIRVADLEPEHQRQKSQPQDSNGTPSMHTDSVQLVAEVADSTQVIIDAEPQQEHQQNQPKEANSTLSLRADSMQMVTQNAKSASTQYTDLQQQRQTDAIRHAGLDQHTKPAQGPDSQKLVVEAVDRAPRVDAELWQQRQEKSATAQYTDLQQQRQTDATRHVGLDQHTKPVQSPDSQKLVVEAVDRAPRMDAELWQQRQEDHFQDADNVPARHVQAADSAQTVDGQVQQQSQKGHFQDASSTSASHAEPIQLATEDADSARAVDGKLQLQNQAGHFEDASNVSTSYVDSQRQRHADPIQLIAEDGGSARTVDAEVQKQHQKVHAEDAISPSAQQEQRHEDSKKHIDTGTYSTATAAMRTDLEGQRKEEDGQLVDDATRSDQAQYRDAQKQHEEGSNQHTDSAIPQHTGAQESKMGFVDREAAAAAAAHSAITALDDLEPPSKPFAEGDEVRRWSGSQRSHWSVGVSSWDAVLGKGKNNQHRQSNQSEADSEQWFDSYEDWSASPEQQRAGHSRQQQQHEEPLSSSPLRQAMTRETFSNDHRKDPADDDENMSAKSSTASASFSPNQRMSGGTDSVDTWPATASPFTARSINDDSGDDDGYWTKQNDSSTAAPPLPGPAPVAEHVSQHAEHEQQQRPQPTDRRQQPSAQSASQPQMIAAYGESEESESEGEEHHFGSVAVASTTYASHRLPQHRPVVHDTVEEFVASKEHEEQQLQQQLIPQHRPAVHDTVEEFAASKEHEEEQLQHQEHQQQQQQQQPIWQPDGEPLPAPVEQVLQPGQLPPVESDPGQSTSAFGKLYVRLSSADGVLLPVPPKLTTYVRCVVSDSEYEYMSRYEVLGDRVVFDYECIMDAQPDMIITVSMHVRPDPHVRPKTGLSKWLTSVRKQRETLAAYVHPEDGAIGQTRFALGHMIQACNQKTYVASFDCFNSWYARSPREQHMLKVVGNLNLEMLYLPVSDPALPIPKSMRECDLALRIRQWHNTCWHSGFLSMRLPGSELWDRHYCRLIGSQLIGYSSKQASAAYVPQVQYDITHAVRLVASSDQVIVTLVDMPDTRVFQENTIVEETGRGFFRIAFADSYVDCVCDDPHGSEGWVKILKSMIGRVPLKSV